MIHSFVDTLARWLTFNRRWFIISFPGRSIFLLFYLDLIAVAENRMASDDNDGSGGSNHDDSGEDSLSHEKWVYGRRNKLIWRWFTWRWIKINTKRIETFFAFLLFHFINWSCLTCARNGKLTTTTTTSTEDVDIDGDCGEIVFVTVETFFAHQMGYECDCGVLLLKIKLPADCRLFRNDGGESERGRAINKQMENESDRRKYFDDVSHLINALRPATPWFVAQCVRWTQIA